jgi:predicted amino acid-binding ACT domain protein
MHLLKLNCPDAVGLLARITGFIAASGGNLLDVSQYTDPVSRWFFTRLAFTGGMVEDDFARFEQDTRVLADSMNAQWTLRHSDRPVRRRTSTKAIRPEASSRGETPFCAQGSGTPSPARGRNQPTRGGRSTGAAARRQRPAGARGTTITERRDTHTSAPASSVMAISRFQ